MCAFGPYVLGMLYIFVVCFVYFGCIWDDRCLHGIMLQGGCNICVVCSLGIYACIFQGKHRRFVC